MSFTFKTEQPTGKYRCFDNPTHHVKLNKVEIGYISPEEPFKIKLTVIKNQDDIAKPKNNPNCPWKWITLKHESKSLQEAKEFLKENFDLIMKTFTFPKE
jgi:hypothetical protein